MIDFNPKRNVLSSIGLHIHSKSCALAKGDNSFKYAKNICVL